MVVLAEFCRLQRTLILYPGNIPEFVLSEDILSLQKVSHCWGAATDFHPQGIIQCFLFKKLLDWG